MPRNSIGTAEERYDGRRLSARRSEGRGGQHRPIRFLIVLLVIVAVLLVVALVGFLVLSGTGAFTISYLDTEATEHLSEEDVGKLANVPEGTTLLSFDEAVITQNLQRNPWVGEVTYVREFPDRLKIVVTERTVDCLVKMGTGSVCWCLSDDGVWIEPVNLTVPDGRSSDDEALAMAKQMGAVLIVDVPTSVSPSAGETATDEVLKAVAAYREQFSQEFAAQIVRFSASSVESISCTLASGVEVSLGGPTNIDVKEAVVQQILERHPNQITYINVRVPSQPSYRKLGVDTVAPGTGVVVGEPTDGGSEGSSTAPTSATQSDATAGATAEGTADGSGTDATSATDAGMGADGATDQPPVGADGSELILGDDGNYYTYEQYWGLD